jgi:uncharacterized protein YbjT (DUF2867 family)
VRAATRNPGSYAPPHTDVEAVHFDYEDPETFKTALAGVTRVSLVAKPLDTKADLHISRFVDTARQAGVQHIVFTSAYGVDWNNDVPLRKSERAIESSGLTYTFLRPNFFMENFSSGEMVSTIRDQGSIYLPAGDARTSFISVEDIGAVAVAALTDKQHQNQAYTLTGSEALTHGQVAKILTNVTGRQIDYVSISDDDMIRVLQENGLNLEEAGYLSMLYKLVREGHMAHVMPELEQLLGRTPVTFETFARQNADIWKA